MTTDEGRAVAEDARSRPEAPGRTRTIATWILSGLLALAMLAAGAAKLVGAPAMVQLFVDIGAGQGLRWVVGALEILGAVGLLVPRVRAWAALGLVLLLLGATVTNLLILHTNTAASVLYGLAALAVLLLRRAELRSPRLPAAPVPV